MMRRYTTSNALELADAIHEEYMLIPPDEDFVITPRQELIIELYERYLMKWVE